MVNRIMQAIRWIDGLQRRVVPAAFAFGTMKKFGDDRGGHLAALITYYGFISLFPGLLALVTILNLAAGGSTAFTQQIKHSALAEIPVLGTQIGQNIHAQTGSTLALIIGFLGLVWGSQAAIQVGQFAMAQVWNVPGVARPNFAGRLVRTLTMMLVLGVFFVVSTAAAGFVSFAHTLPALADIGSIALSFVLNVCLYSLAFRILTPRTVASRHLWPGAVIGGVGWTILQVAGATLVEHNLQGARPLYGFFAIVLGLLAWIYLGATLTMYAAEINVVIARRLWPRSVLQPPLTAADERVLAAISEQEQRRPEQHVTVQFAHDPAPDRPPAPDGRPIPDGQSAPGGPPASDRPPSPGDTRPPEPATR